MLGEGGWGSREEDERRGEKKRVLLLLQLVCPEGVRKRWGSGEFVVHKDTMIDAGKVRTFEEMMRGRGRGGVVEPSVSEEGGRERRKEGRKEG